MPDLPKLKRPPIVERIIGVYKQIPQPEFEQKLPAWAERIRSDYPIAEPLSEWEIEIEEKDGVPLIKNLIPKVRLIHLFWKHHPKGRHVKGMRLRPDRLVFHLNREEDDPHSFAELIAEIEKWLPLWASHFGIPFIDGITLEYVNVLNSEITPQFVNADGTIKLSEALAVFSTFPGPIKGFTDPYDCRARLIMDDAKQTFFDVRVRGREGRGGRNEIRVDFNVRFSASPVTLSFAEAIGRLKRGHEIMLQQFACFFTEKAVQSFT